jgi:hypothetical protein
MFTASRYMSDSPKQQLSPDKSSGSTERKNPNRSREDMFQQFAAGKLFRLVAILQTGIHLCSYMASFIKLIAIEGGGYYNAAILLFISITMLSMPLFLVSYWLIERSLRISKQARLNGYFFHIAVLIWSIFIVNKSYAYGY